MRHLVCGVTASLALIDAAMAAKADAILVHHGELDTRLAGTWPAYDKQLTDAKVPHEGYVYPGANHGFNRRGQHHRYR